MRLFGKELKQVVYSILFLVFTVAVLGFYVMQYFVGVNGDIMNAKNVEFGYEGNKLPEPIPGQESYGMVYTENPEVVMPKVLIRLYEEYGTNRYATYPIGFLKYVKLNEQKQAEVEKIMQKVTGLSYQEIVSIYHEFLNENMVYLEGGIEMVNPDADPNGIFEFIVDFEEYKEEMAKIDDLLGGGSFYGSSMYGYTAREERTYEQALSEHIELVEEDKVTRGYARLFCDYMGIAVALFSVFLPVGFLLRDRRANMQQLIYSRRQSSFRIICTRYIACLVAIMSIVFLLALISTVPLLTFCKQIGYDADPYAFFAYTIGWILPTAMVCCSTGFFFTILTNTPIGIAVQFIWSFIDMSTGVIRGGDYGYALALRHNQVGGRNLMLENMDIIIKNRIGYVIFSLVLLGCSIVFYELQRRGKIDVYGWFQLHVKRSKNAVPAHVAD